MDIIRKQFIKPFENKQKGNVGTELEFPLLNMAKKPVSIQVAQRLLDLFLEKGFKTEETTLDGKSAFIINKHGDVLSFDNSYNNFEFAMNYGDNLCDIAARFYSYFETAQQYAKENNHILAGMGTNPYKKYINQSRVNFPVYNMVNEYLHTFPAKHSYPDFPAYLSSVQTHLDLPLSQLPLAATVFARLDFIRALLFSNSPSWDGGNIICYRDYLWEGSAFPDTNTGKVDEQYLSQHDIIESFTKRKMFNRVKDGKYIAFAPVLLSDYFDGKNDDDIKYFLSFRNVEITARGTVEIRSDCTQPVYHAFAPSAFSLGILYKLDEAKELLDSFKTQLKTSQLRNAVINGQEIRLPKDFVLLFVELAYQGLMLRQKGEEKFLAPLFERAKLNMCPGKDTLSRLKKGESMEKIILDYSKTC